MFFNRCLARPDCAYIILDIRRIIMSSFVDAVKVCVVQKPFNWKDRATRSEFWWCMLFVFLANIVIGILGLIPAVGAIIGFVGGAALSWLNTIVAIRRLHDLNKRGFWLAGVYVPLFIGAVLYVLGLEEREEGLIYAGSTLCLIGIGFYIYLFVLFCLRGTVGPNRFGPDPLNGVPGAFPQAAQNFAPNMQQQQPAQFFGQNQGFNPNQQGFNPNQQGFAPNQQGFNPNQQGFAPNQQGFYQNQQGFNPNQQGFNPNQQGFNPNQQGFNPNQQGFNPNQQGFYQNQQGFNPNQQGFNPNQQGFNPNQQGFAPNQQGFNPNQQGFAPNQQGFNPNQQGFDPNQQAMPNTAAAPAPAQAVAPEAAPAQDVAPQTAQDAAVEAVPAQETKEEAVEQKESK